MCLTRMCNKQIRQDFYTTLYHIPIDKFYLKKNQKKSANPKFQLPSLKD